MPVEDHCYSPAFEDIALYQRTGREERRFGRSCALVDAQMASWPLWPRNLIQPPYTNLTEARPPLRPAPILSRTGCLISRNPIFCYPFAGLGETNAFPQWKCREVVTLLGVALFIMSTARRTAAASRGHCRWPP